MTMCATQTAWTEDFAALELKAEEKATQHTDVFAYGETVHWVHANGRCEPTEHEDDRHQARGHASAFVAALTTDQPSIRPCATDAIQAPFFAILKAVNRKVKKDCAVCGEEQMRVKRGIECGCACFMCDECVGRQVMILIQQQREGGEGPVMCCHRTCTLPDRDLSRLLPADAFVQLLESRQRLFEERLAGENNEHIKQGVRDEVARLDAMSAHHRKVVKARQHIEEEIQQMKCPRCRKAFYDFEGCFAISCGGSCLCNFCGWCLSDCGDRHAAHAHVRFCPHKPPVSHVYYGAEEEFREAHATRCRRELSKYLEQLEPQAARTTHLP